MQYSVVNFDFYGGCKKMRRAQNQKTNQKKPNKRRVYSKMKSSIKLEKSKNEVSSSELDRLSHASRIVRKTLIKMCILLLL